MAGTYLAERAFLPALDGFLSAALFAVAAFAPAAEFFPPEEFLDTALERGCGEDSWSEWSEETAVG